MLAGSESPYQLSPQAYRSPISHRSSASHLNRLDNIIKRELPHRGISSPVILQARHANSQMTT